MTKQPEQELACSVVAWLRDQRWEVYQEVSTGYGCPRADLVATQGGLTWIIETKTSLSLGLLAQAANWIGWANFVSVAIPNRRRRGGSYEFAVRLLRERGIGLFEIGEMGSVREDAPRKIRRIRRHSITDFLCDEQKTTGEAGSARGGYVTPFSITCHAILGFVAEHPGCTVRELVDGIEHHYANYVTARSCLSAWIRDGVVPGVERRHVNGRWRVFPIAEKGKS